MKHEERLASENWKNRVLARLASPARLYHPGSMAHFDWDKAIREWRNQELALFARRAHRKLGRGFVLSGDSDLQPMYVTWIAGAPQPLIDAVFGYDPEREAVVVFEDESDDDSIIVDCVTIQSRH